MACTLAPPSPEVLEVSPAWGWNGEETAVTLEGARFFPAVRVVGESEGSLDGRFEASLVRDAQVVPMLAVEHLDDGTLVARVPEGLQPGVWDLRVQTPAGGEDTLADAFTVTDTRADRLDLVASTAAYTAGDTARVVVRVLDPDGARVAAPMLVEVLAASPTGAAGVTFLGGGLAGQVPNSAGVGIRGQLEADGEGTFFVRSSTPDDVTFRVRPLTLGDVVASDELLLSWRSGDIAAVDIELPSDDFRATAGQTFSVDVVLRDAFGNELDDALANVLVYDTCGAFRAGVAVRGRETVPVTLTKACANDSLRVFTENREWSSGFFPVDAGAYVAYDITANVDVAIAGEPDLVAAVAAVDAWGNVVGAPPAGLVLRDELGGLDPTTGAGRAVCTGFPVDGPAQQLCTFTLDRAGETRLVARDPAGRSGASDAILVVPNLPSEVALRAEARPVAAGERFEVGVRVLDAYGNAVAADEGDPVTWTDDSGTVRCDPDGVDGAELVFGCTLTAAGDQQVTVDALDVRGSLRQRVINGVLADVEVLPSTTNILAGDPLTVDFRAWDAWGNAWLVQDDPRVNVDIGGTAPWSTTVTFDGSGRASTELRLTQAASTHLLAVRGGVVLGAATVEVRPGPLTALDMQVDAWTSRDAPLEVELFAVDAFGNVVVDESGDVALTSEDGACEDTLVSLVAGGAHVSVDCARPTLDTTLTATFESLVALSPPFDVVDLACDRGPTAVVLVDGSADARVCLTSDVLDVDVDVRASVPGDAPIVRTWVSDGAGDWIADTEGRASIEVVARGTQPIEALTIDADGCASRDVARVWVGAPDGSATGPVSVGVPALASAGDVVRATLLAVACDGGPATGVLGVRVDVGSVAAMASGSGLYVPLDATGAATVNWTLTDGHGGAATFHAGGVSAWGAGTLQVAGDAVEPRVAWTSLDDGAPSAGESILVAFSEPVRTSTAQMLLLTDTSSTMLEAIWDEEGRTATLQVPSDLATDVVVTLEVAAATSDRAGNLLSGGGWARSFGPVASAPAPGSCVASASSLSPDGDMLRTDSSVRLDWVAMSSPDSWDWTVWRGDARVASGTAPGSARTLIWDGTGDDGRFVSSGAHRLVLRGNASGLASSDACTVNVTVVQPLAEPSASR